MNKPELIQALKNNNKERGRNNFHNYASQLQAAFAKSQNQAQITKILK